MEEVAGQGWTSGRVASELSEVVEEILSFDAKLSDGGSGVLIGNWGGLAARLDVGGTLANGLAAAGHENGFAQVEEGRAGAVPKSAAPKSSRHFWSCARSASAFPSCAFAGAGWVDPYRLTSRKALILPCFRLQAFLRQPKICSLRSSLGK